MSRRLAAALVILASLAACQSPPLAPEQIAALDYGPRPENYEQIVRDFLRSRLNDPGFALVEIKTGPAPLYQSHTLSRRREHGWGVCVMVSERDPRGFYSGYPMVIYIREGRVVAQDGGGLERAAGVGYANVQCATLGYLVPN